MANEIEIVITSKDKTKPGMDSARKGADGVTKAGGKLSSVLTGIGLAAGQAAAGLVAIGFDKVISGVTDSVGLAQDLNESMNKVNVVFGEAADGIKMWADQTSTAIGLSEGAALDAAGTFGNMFDQLDIGAQTSSSMSQEIVNLAADFASFHNADISDVIDAQSAAFRGEYDALQRFLPLINAAAVEQKALAMTGKENAKALTQQDKALATHKLMLEGAGAAQGDFAATAHEGANAQRIAAAEMENAKAQLGEKLLPLQAKFTQLQVKLAQVLTDKVVPAVGELIGWFEKNQATFEQIGSVMMGVLIPAFEAFLAVLKFLGENKELVAAMAVGIMAALVPAFIAWATAAGAAAIATITAAAPLILIGVLVAALAFIVFKYWDEIAAFTSDTFGFIWDYIKQVFNWIKDNWKLLLTILTGPIGVAVAMIIKHWDKVKSATQTVFGWIKTYVNFVFNFIKANITVRINLILAVIRKVRSVFSAVFGTVKRVVSGAMSKVKSDIFGVVNSVVRKIKAIGNAISNIPGAGAVSSAVSYLPSFATGGISTGGLSLVGERGPELVNLKPGQRVHPNSSFSQVGGGSAGGLTVIMNIAGSVLSENDFVEIVRDEFRRGGFDGAVA